MVKGYSIRWLILISIGLAVVTFASYSSVVTHPFVNYDDDVTIIENPHVQTGLSAGNIRWAFASVEGGNWHPLTWLSHMADVSIFGMNAGGHHLVSLAIHALNALLLFLVLFQMTGVVWRSAIVAALFALHPLHVESVAWAAERKDVLSMFFFTAAISCYVAYVRKPRVQSYLLVVVVFAMSLMSKPMAVTFPIVLLLLDYWPLARFRLPPGPQAEREAIAPPNRLHRLVLEKAPLIAMSVASSVVTVVAQASARAIDPLENHGLGVRIANALVSYASYIWKMVWPSQLAAFYPHPGSNIPMWQIAGATVLVLGVTGVAINQARHRPWFAAGWFWYLATLVPVIGLVQVGSQAMADRYTYVPIIGLFIIVAWSCGEAIERWRLGKAVPAVIAGAALCVLSIMTWFQVGYWRSSETLFRHAIEATSDNWAAEYALGLEYGRQGRFDEAVLHSQRAIHLSPRNAEAYINLGSALFKLGKADEAIDCYFGAVRINPRHALAHYNLGIALMSQGKVDDALAHFRKSVEIDSENADAHLGLAKALEKVGKHDEASFHYRDVRRLLQRR